MFAKVMSTFVLECWKAFLISLKFKMELGGVIGVFNFK